MMDYEANAGQTYMPVQDNTDVEVLPYEPLKRPRSAASSVGTQHDGSGETLETPVPGTAFYPGVSARMLDWFWANMEKGYYLWAPGSHKRFSWVKAPWQYGFIHSVHMIAESVGKETWCSAGKALKSTAGPGLLPVYICTAPCSGGGGIQ